jgi:hypothetical protein
MSGTERIFFSGHIRRGNWGRVARDILLLPPALIYIIVEHIFWAGAKALLRATSRIAAVNIVQARLHRLPAIAVLPLFLVPEIVSHLGGLWATVLLVEHRFVAATLAGIFIKGFATLLTVWIYETCQATLLSVRWFAWLHHVVLRGRDWTARRTRRLRRYATHLLRGSRTSITRRFKAIRVVLASKLGLSHR